MLGPLSIEPVHDPIVALHREAFSSFDAPEEAMIIHSQLPDRGRVLARRSCEGRCGDEEVRAKRLEHSSLDAWIYPFVKGIFHVAFRNRPMDKFATMPLHPTELRSRLQTAIDGASLDATELARRIGRSPEYIRDFINGRKNSIKANELVLIEVELKTEPGFLTGFGIDIPAEATQPILRGFRGAPPKQSSTEDYDNLFRQGRIVFSENRLPVLMSHEGIEDDVMIVDVNPFDFVPRPWFYREIKEGYAVVVSTYNYDPVFSINDLLFVNPKMPLLKGRTTLLTASNDLGTFRSRLVEMVDWSKETWTIRRLGDHHKEQVSREEWPNALRVIARVEG